jgi:hypothetical protein
MRRLLLALSLASLTLVPNTAAAQAYLGFQGNWGDRYDWGIGGRVTVDLTPKLIPLMIAGSYDYYWPGETLTRDFDYWEVNVNALFVQRVFGVGTGGYASGYLGIGLNIANPSVTIKESGAKSSDTDVGLNLLGGTKYHVGRVSPYFDIGFTFWGAEQVKVTFGVDVALARDF